MISRSESKTHPIVLAGLLIVLHAVVALGVSKWVAFSENQTQEVADQTESTSQPKTDIGNEDSGALIAKSSTSESLGKCPLEHTDVQAKISGYVARVQVKQSFKNQFKEKIEAIYTFPLPSTAAVDEMTMKVGSRTIHGTVRAREEARELYERAKTAGNTASLLDQERPNIFTQHLANIAPGQSVEVTLNYVDILPYKAGSFEFTFPTVVGPRFNPGSTATSQNSVGSGMDISRISGASLIAPLFAAAGGRSGHDISIDVQLDAGVKINKILSQLHDIDIQREESGIEDVHLKQKSTIPNRDFVLTYEVAVDKIQSGYLAHKSGDNGYLTMMVLPPRRVTPAQVAPKEMIFVVDTSGSQSGQPLQKAKETLLYIVDHMNANDTFQVITFSDHVNTLFKKPQHVNADLRERAKDFIAGLTADGGTYMAPAIEKVCSIPADRHRLRIVTLMTDGYIGNDMEILETVRKFRMNSRWFPFGTGDSVNRFLIDQMAKEGGGEADYVLLNSSGEKVAKEFYDKISSPVLTDVTVKFDGIDARDVYPSRVSDLWAERPLFFQAKYKQPGQGKVTISGFAGGKPYLQTMNLTLPAAEPRNQIIASLWGRAKVDDLMSQDWAGIQSGSLKPDLKNQIVRIGIEHHILTQYTSFIAIDENTKSTTYNPLRVQVPVEMPQGVTNTPAYRSGRRYFQPSGQGPGLVGAPCDPRFGQSNEVGQMADFGYDTARDIVRVIWVIVSFLALLLAGKVAATKHDGRYQRKNIITAVAILVMVPTVANFIGIFIINNI